MIKKNIVITILSLFLITALEATAQHAHLKVYPKASQIQWTGYGAIGNYSLSGTLDITEGIFEVDSLQQLVNGVLVLNMKRIDHDNNTLVKHLKSEDFFAVAKYPRARVNIKNITNGIMKGTLTIKGITKPITVPYKRVNSDKGIVLKGMVTIDRTLYGINYNSDSFFKNLGANAIKNTFDVNFKIKLNPL